MVEFKPSKAFSSDLVKLLSDSVHVPESGGEHSLVSYINCDNTQFVGQTC